MPAEGWQVWDGGWSVFVIDPAGFTLGGEHAGIHKAHAPMIPDTYGSSLIRCQMALQCRARLAICELMDTMVS